jgi:hypothetical protein
MGWGRDGIVKEGFFAGRPAALKFYVPELAEDPAAATAFLAAEQHAYAALEDLQGELKPSESCIQSINVKMKQGQSAAVRLFHLQGVSYRVCLERGCSEIPRAHCARFWRWSGSCQLVLPDAQSFLPPTNIWVPASSCRRPSYDQNLTT